MSKPKVGTAQDLDVQMVEFVASLARAGYARSTLYGNKRLITPFIRWVREVGLGSENIDEACLDAFLACPVRRRYGHRSALQRFVQHLRLAGVVPQLRLELSPTEVLVKRYVAHLREEQGLSLHSVNVYLQYVRPFVVAQGLPENGATLDALGIRRHLLSQSRNRSESVVRLLAAALRSFLRFCYFDNITATNLSPVVMPVRRSQLATVPRFLSAVEVERVIAASDRSTARGCRAFAILLLLARLGLRASEIICLELEDIRWESGEIVIRGKGQVIDRLPLLADVGDALAQYLTTARGPSRSRRVFLRRIAPRVGLSQPADVSKIAREALQRAGLLPPGRVGAHIFRHSLATRMIRSGAALAEISQVLRHRSLGTTELYTKVELEGLRGVALPWPRAEVAR